jgi:gas vesicle protein
MGASKFLAGAILGLVAGLLLAPQKGEDLRNDLVDTTEKWKKKLSKLTGETTAELDDLREMLGEEISGLSDDLRYRILTILEEGQASASKIKSNFASELG